MSDLIDDLAKALYGLRLACAKHNIPCPDVLEYSDTEKAYRAAPVLRNAASYHAAQYAMDQSAKPWVEVSLHGFTLRFSARQIERPGTGLDLDNGVDGRVFMDRPKDW